MHCHVYLSVTEHGVPTMELIMVGTTWQKERVFRDGRALTNAMTLKTQGMDSWYFYAVSTYYVSGIVASAGEGAIK